MWRSVSVVVAVAATAVGSVAVAQVGPIDDAAVVDRPARRVAPPTPGPSNPDERAALEAVELVNRERIRRGLPAYEVHELVTVAAAAHSADMAERGRMTHSGVDGSDAGDRLTRAGFAWRAWGEAVGAGFATPQLMVAAWLGSPGHRDRLLSSQRYVGVGVVAGSDGGPYWTLVVAS